MDHWFHILWKMGPKPNQETSVNVNETCFKHSGSPTFIWLIHYHHVSVLVLVQYVPVQAVGPPPNWVVGVPNLEDHGIVLLEQIRHNLFRVLNNTAFRAIDRGKLVVQKGKAITAIMGRTTWMRWAWWQRCHSTGCWCFNWTCARIWRLGIHAVCIMLLGPCDRSNGIIRLDMSIASCPWKRA